jgi:hypothetical protein
MHCKACKWFKETETYGRIHKGECHMKAPSSFQVAGETCAGIQEARPWSGWPDVKEYDFCGEFSAKSGNT